MSKLTLYHAPRTRSGTVLCLLEEIGAPYDLHVLDTREGAHRTPDYLAINPMGKVPALRHGDHVTTEAAAICLYLADAFPSAGLAPALSDPERGPFLTWMFFGPSCIEPALTDIALKRDAAPASIVGYGSLETVLDRISRTLSAARYLVGGRFSAADVAIGSALRWGMAFKLIPPRPEFEAYVGQLSARPAAQRATAKDAELLAARGG